MAIKLNDDGSLRKPDLATHRFNSLIAPVLVAIALWIGLPLGFVMVFSCLSGAAWTLHVLAYMMHREALREGWYLPLVDK